MTYGDRLGNGAVVIAHNAPKGIVLASWRNEFVTWSFDAFGGTVVGHYFPTLSAATADFITRIVNSRIIREDGRL